MLKLPSWNPIEIFLIAAAVVSGIAGILNNKDTSQLVKTIVPEYILTGWYIGLSLSSIAILYGLFKFKYYYASMGYSILSCISIAYSTIILAIGGSPLAYSAIVTLAFGVAGIFRGLQLFGLLKQAAKEVEE